MAHEVRTEILIHATPATVWQVLTDFASYPTRQGYIRSVSGQVAVGQQLTIDFQTDTAKKLTVKVKVLAVDPNQELRWGGHLLLPGLLDGIHRFELLDQRDGTTLFRQSEAFRGLQVPLARKTLDKTNTPAFRGSCSKRADLHD